MKKDILSKIIPISMKVEDIFKESVFSGEKKVKKVTNSEGYVFSLLGDKKLYLMIDFFTLREDAYDGAYYSYNFNYIPLDSAISGKRGVKIKEAVMSYSSMKDPSRERVESKDIVLIGKIKFNYMPEKIKIIEKEGWKV